jgi:hypothetical protein
MRNPILRIGIVVAVIDTPVSPVEFVFALTMEVAMAVLG